MRWEKPDYCVLLKIIEEITEKYFSDNLKSMKSSQDNKTPLFLELFNFLVE